MKTRFSSLLAIKKDALQKREQQLQQAHLEKEQAKRALEDARKTIESLQQPQSGSMTDFLANRTLLSHQRAIIQDKEIQLNLMQQRLQEAQEALKNAMIEYEKFNYLEVQELEKIMQAAKIAEIKRLDEVALMTFNKKKDTSRRAS
jgi:flagellar export protein FliJ